MADETGAGLLGAIAERSRSLLQVLAPATDEVIAGLRTDQPDRAIAAADALLEVLRPLIRVEAVLRGTSKARLSQPHANITYREARGTGVVIGGQRPGGGEQAEGGTEGRVLRGGRATGFD